MIETTDPDYEPWASPILEVILGGELPGEVESMLFCVQTGIGVGIIAFIMGRFVERKKWIKDTEISLSIEGLTMDAIYETLVRQVAGERIITQSESLREDVEKSTQREMLLKKIEILRRKEAKERQPQKKFVLHQQRIVLELKISKE